MRATLRRAAFAAVLALCPAVVAAQGTSQTFTDRPSFRGALADRDIASTIVNLMAPSVTAADIGVARVATSGGCIAAPDFTAAGSAKSIDFDNGTCGAGALTFALKRSDISAFGFYIHPVDIPGGPITVNVTTTFNGAVDGERTVSYHLGDGFADGYFALLLDPDQAPPGATGLESVVVSTNADAHITLHDVEFAPLATPEPAAVSLLGAGLLAIGAAARRRRAG